MRSLRLSVALASTLYAAAAPIEIEGADWEPLTDLASVVPDVTVPSKLGRTTNSKVRNVDRYYYYVRRTG